MPRVKAATKASSRAKPKLPDGDEGAALTAEQKREKLELMLQDFDNEVLSRIEQMRTDAKKMCDSINTCYRMELMKLPKDMRKMKRKEFLEAGGTISAVQLREVDEVVDEIAASIDSKAHRTCKKTKPGSLTENSEEEEPATTTKGRRTTRKGRAATTRKTRQKTVLANNTTDNVMPPPAPTTTRSKRSKPATRFQTPAYGRGASVAGWDTPLVTPKFDPRLPITPAMCRQPKPGERLMSLAGSPIANKRAGGGAVGGDVESPPELKVEIKQGKVTLGDLDLDDVSGPMDIATIQNIKMLQEKLAAILRPATK